MSTAVLVVGLIVMLTGLLAIPHLVAWKLGARNVSVRVAVPLILASALGSAGLANWLLWSVLA